MVLNKQGKQVHVPIIFHLKGAWNAINHFNYSKNQKEVDLKNKQIVDFFL